MNEFSKLYQIVAKLRDPNGGCPWDLEQTHQSLLPYLVEESYEFIHAAEIADDVEMEEELGDVLLQVLLHSVIASQRNSFSLESVAKKLAEKLVRRHPHVFAKAQADITSEQVAENWQKIKATEKPSSPKSAIPLKTSFYPALTGAYKIGKKSKKIKFDWENATQVQGKVEEELAELKQEVQLQDQEKMKEEMGDFLFSIAQWARHLGLDPEECLQAANKKFLKRFHKIENLIRDKGKDISTMDQSEMDIYWNQVKEQENASK